MAVIVTACAAKCLSSLRLFGDGHRRLKQIVISTGTLVTEWLMRSQFLEINALPMVSTLPGISHGQRLAMTDLLWLYL